MLNCTEPATYDCGGAELAEDTLEECRRVSTNSTWQQHCYCNTDLCNDAEMSGCKNKAEHAALGILGFAGFLVLLLVGKWACSCRRREEDPLII